MKATQHLEQEDLALFALQFLQDEELDGALDHLEHCEDCRHDVAKYQGDLVGYALATAELHSPPAAARERLMKRVAKEKKVVPIERPVLFEKAAVAEAVEKPIARAIERPSGVTSILDRHATERPSGVTPVAASEGELFLAGRRMFEMDAPEERGTSTGRASSYLAWAGWAVAATMAVTAGLQYRERQNLQGEVVAQAAKLDQTNSQMAQATSTLQMLTSGGAMQVSLHPMINGAPEPPKPGGHAAYDSESGKLVFIADHLQPLQAYKTYELWLLQPEVDGVKRAPVPAGTFKPDVRGTASVVMPELPPNLTAAGFAVTVEDDGGSKTPTLPIVLAGL